MKKKIYVVMFSVFMVVALSSFCYAEEITEEEWIKWETNLANNYQKLTDQYNKQLGPDLEVKIKKQIPERKFAGDYPMLFFMCQYMDLALTDLANCATDSKKREKFNSTAFQFRSLKAELIRMYPDERKDGIVEILQNAKDYYFKTKTRMIKFSKCKGKI